MTDLRNQLGVSAQKRARSVTKCELRGRFTLTLSETNNRGIGVSQDLVSWHDTKKDKMRFHVSDLLHDHLHIGMMKYTVFQVNLRILSSWTPKKAISIC